MGKILKIFHGDNQYIKRKIKYFLPKHLVEIKKGCIFALANQERKSVNIYEFHMDALMDLNALLFDVPSEEWIDFVMKNRIQKDFTHNYDIVYGPVANDRVYAAFALYEGGLIDKQNLISELKTYKLVDQYLFHTDKALKTLAFIDALEITL